MPLYLTCIGSPEESLSRPLIRLVLATYYVYILRVNLAVIRSSMRESEIGLSGRADLSTVYGVIPNTVWPCADRLGPEMHWVVRLHVDRMVSLCTEDYKSDYAYKLSILPVLWLQKFISDTSHEKTSLASFFRNIIEHHRVILLQFNRVGACHGHGRGEPAGQHLAAYRAADRVGQIPRSL